jgi:hypothetical protein
MRLQLTVFSLLILLAFLLRLLPGLFPPSRGRRFGVAPPPGGAGLADTMERVFKDSLYTYLPFAAVALLMLSYGKPGLFPQWAGWAVVGLQLLRSIALGSGLARVAVLLGLLALVCLAYLWILQLPVFDPYPA